MPRDSFAVMTQTRHSVTKLFAECKNVSLNKFLSMLTKTVVHQALLHYTVAVVLYAFLQEFLSNALGINALKSTT